MERLTVLGSRLALAGPQGATPVRLKGFNRSGFQHKPSLVMAGMPDPEAELRAFAATWNARIIRFPLALDLYLDSAPYRDDLDRVVTAAEAAGVYLMLEFHGVSDAPQPPLPPRSIIWAWGELARFYGGRSHVVFDLFNEPHGVPWKPWKELAEACIQAIRNAGATETLIVVGGLDWAYDLSPLCHPKNRIADVGPLAYATHPYPFKGVPAHREAEWDRYFGEVSEKVPVLVAEFGADGSGIPPFGFGTNEEAVEWLGALLAYIDARGLSGMAWSVGDMPHLVHSAPGTPVVLPAAPPHPDHPTEPFGVMVRDWMRA
jgi:hypothetical protein